MSPGMHQYGLAFTLQMSDAFDKKKKKTPCHLNVLFNWAAIPILTKYKQPQQCRSQWTWNYHKALFMDRHLPCLAIIVTYNVPAGMNWQASSDKWLVCPNWNEKFLRDVTQSQPNWVYSMFNIDQDFKPMRFHCGRGSSVQHNKNRKWMDKNAKDYSIIFYPAVFLKMHIVPKQLYKELIWNNMFFE